jgi:hypothetical protein
MNDHWRSVRGYRGLIHGHRGCIPHLERLLVQCVPSDQRRGVHSGPMGVDAWPLEVSLWPHGGGFRTIGREFKATGGGFVDSLSQFRGCRLISDR